MPKSRIHILSDTVANKIAAGEVVERPSSVLKELVENALDSGACQVDVKIVSGGRKLISVADNGSGMSRDDALLSIERHATSKIRDIDDIENITTLGFRGEALAAISSVSRFRIATCEPGAAGGTEIVVSGGKVLEVNEGGFPSGTLLEVRDLFFNVPARRKFLRSVQTELSHARQMFIVQALAHPSVGMSLTVDGRELYRFAADATLEDRLRDIFGTDHSRELRRVDTVTHGVSVTGYAAPPALSRGDRHEQFFFVNNRPASAPVLSYALREAYRTLLPGDRHPCVFLFVSVAPALVDVNVHPTKREVRFRRAGDVRDAAIEALRSALTVGGTTPRGSTTHGSVEGLKQRQAGLAIDDLPATRTFHYPRIPMTPETDSGAPSEATTDGDRTLVRGSAPWTWSRVLGQVGGLYVILETEDGYVIMDPHAAHERVLFERFMADVIESKVESQGLLSPETVELMPSDAQRVRKNMALFRKMGFGICEFGGDSFVVDALPSYFAGTAPQRLLIDIAECLEKAGSRGAAEGPKEEAVARAACHAAIKANDRMSLAEIEKLVVDLANTEMPYTCPHGRPTLIFTPFKELNRKFGRGGDS